MNRNQPQEHPTGVIDSLKLENNRECPPMARGIFAQEAWAPTSSGSKRGTLRTREPMVGDRRTRGGEGLSPGDVGSAPLRQRTQTSAVLFLKCS